jgi:hypothetical protein
MWLKALAWQTTVRRILAAVGSSGVFLVAMFTIAAQFWLDSFERREPRPSTRIGMVVPIVFILLFVIVVDARLLQLGLRIAARLNSSPTQPDKALQKNHMIQRILSIAKVLFVVIQIKLATALVAFVHVMCLTGLFVYSEKESSYKMLVYGILWEIELIAITTTLAWVVKTRETPMAESESQRNNNRGAKSEIPNVVTKPLLQDLDEDDFHNASCNTSELTEVVTPEPGAVRTAALVPPSDTTAGRY